MPTPLHPALVHLPLGLAVVMPLLALAAVVLAFRRPPSRAPALGLVLLQALLVGGGILALRSGEAEEDRVEKVVGEAALHRHEAAAKQFLLAAGVTLLLAGAALALGSGPAGAWALLPVLAATMLTAALAVRAGHAGGQLVYEHGAASVYATAPPARPAPAANDD